jgi:hypothetical protein
MKGATAMGGGTTLGGNLRRIGTMLGYDEDWMASTKKTVEDELRSRGIAPNETTSKPRLPVLPVLLAIAGIVLVCAIIFVAI